MPKMKVIRSADGQIINIGDWDFGIVKVPVIDPDSQQEIYDPSPVGGYVKRCRQEMTNPLPDGAYEDEAEIVQGWDGGLYDVNDPSRLMPSERM